MNTTSITTYNRLLTGHHLDTKYHVAFVVRTSNCYWGKGTTLAEAAVNAMNKGAGKTDHVLVHAVLGTPEQLDSVEVTDFGDLCYHALCCLIPVIAPSHGQRVTLGSLVASARSKN
jgi:hypothetical protein